jgi:hypothetical protein
MSFVLLNHSLMRKNEFSSTSALNISTVKDARKFRVRGDSVEVIGEDDSKLRFSDDMEESSSRRDSFNKEKVEGSAPIQIINSDVPSLDSQGDPQIEISKLRKELEQHKNVQTLLVERNRYLEKELGDTKAKLHKLELYSRKLELHVKADVVSDIQARMFVLSQAKEELASAFIFRTVQHQDTENDGEALDQQDNRLSNVLFGWNSPSASPSAGKSTTNDLNKTAVAKPNHNQRSSSKSPSLLSPSISPSGSGSASQSLSPSRPSSANSQVQDPSSIVSWDNVCPHFLKGRCRQKNKCPLSHSVSQCVYCGEKLPSSKVSASAHLSRCWKERSGVGDGSGQQENIPISQ